MEIAINKRLISVINYLKSNKLIYNESDFSKKLGIGKSFLSDMKAGRKEITEPTVLNICAVFPQLNKEWLLTGKGEMTKEEECSDIQPEYVLHFTKLESALKILESGKIKLSKPSAQQDFYEKEKHRRLLEKYNYNEESALKDFDTNRFFSTIVSDFSLDGKSTHFNSLLWEMYAEKHTGVALIFNVNKLIEENKDVNIFGLKIKYDKHIYNRKFDNIEDTLKYKHTDFSIEDEYRFFVKSDSEDCIIDISKSLSWVFLGGNFTEYYKLKNLNFDKISKCTVDSSGRLVGTLNDDTSIKIKNSIIPYEETIDYKDKYYLEVEENNKLLKKQVETLEELRKYDTEKNKHAEEVSAAQDAKAKTGT